ncbi:MAG: GIY-YIG nuclease family protein [Candidatus Buchananbacteria bacterium]|nr:GIY-YIG nuclease family protein [Candidatus Buchananbacteria bacterium]
MKSLKEKVHPIKTRLAGNLSKTNLFNRASNLPLSSGVYMFIGPKGEILYIGRATSLRRRVAQYFRQDIDPRIAEMVSLAKNIKHQKTDTVLEAIILEANLIKKHWPKYNVKDKDHRSFVFVVIPKKDYAYPIIARERELKKFPTSSAHVFGPYQNATLLKNALRLIRRIFPYSTCTPNSGQPCFDYQVGLCPGTCVGKIAKNDYSKNIKNIILLFKGEKKRLLNKLKKENPPLASVLKNIQDVTLITKDEFNDTAFKNRVEGYDISHFTGKETVGAMSVVLDGQLAKDQYRLFNIKEAPASDDLRALAEMVIRRFKHVEWPFPNLILIDGGRPQIDYINNILKKININIPIIGLSKLAGDRMVFPAKASRAIRELAESQRGVLTKARDEAHRFGNAASRRQRRKRFYVGGINSAKTN